MRAVIQRVTEASVKVDGKITGAIGQGLLILVGVEDADTQDDIDWLGKDYDAATFEKYQETNEVLNQLFKDPRYREKLTPKQFYTTILESGVFGEYANGTIIGEDFNAPA